MTNITFTKWLAQHVREPGDIGDFAREVKGDRSWRDPKSPDDLAKHATGPRAWRAWGRFVQQHERLSLAEDELRKSIALRCDLCGKDLAEGLLQLDRASMGHARVVLVTDKEISKRERRWYVTLSALTCSHACRQRLERRKPNDYHGDYEVTKFFAGMQALPRLVAFRKEGYEFEPAALDKFLEILAECAKLPTWDWSVLA